MELDWQTQRDIELLRGAVAGQSIFDVLDRTRTSDGRKRLQKRFRNPLKEISEIRRVQDVIRFFSTSASGEQFPFIQSDFDSLQQYLDSNLVLLKPADGIGELLGEKWFTIRNPEYTGFVEKEPWAALEFLREAGKLFDRLDTNGCPDLLREDIRFFRAFEQFAGIRDRFQRPVGEKGTIREGIGLDYLFRGELKKSLQHILDRLVDLDGFLSMAIAVRERGLVMPEFIESEAPLLEICGVYHLFLDKAVPNDFGLNEEKGLLFLTGPNMAGKTTYIKAVTVCVLLAQLGMGVPAAAMRLTGFSHIFCSLNAVDNIRENVSSFFSEIRRVKQVLLAMQEEGRVFAVFDELFKGTNVKDALDCSNVVINGLAACSRHAFIVSSHLLELHDLLACSGRICYFHFNGEAKEGKAWFDYRLKPGVNGQRLGFQILREEGLLELLGTETCV